MIYTYIYKLTPGGAVNGGGIQHSTISGYRQEKAKSWRTLRKIGGGHFQKKQPRTSKMRNDMARRLCGCQCEGTSFLDGAEAPSKAPICSINAENAPPTSSDPPPPQTALRHPLPLLPSNKPDPPPKKNRSLLPRKKNQANS